MSNIDDFADASAFGRHRPGGTAAVCGREGVVSGRRCGPFVHGGAVS
ncbi:hypothetical protein [Streptomyces sp. NPDC058382]